jgi:hypothetical protein
LVGELLAAMVVVGRLHATTIGRENVPRLLPVRPVTLFYAAIAVALGVIPSAAWRAGRLGAWALLAMFALGAAVVLFGGAAAWLGRILDHLAEPPWRRSPLSGKAWKRLHHWLAFQPWPKPPGWEGPFSPGGTWWAWVYRTGAISVASWAQWSEAGERFFVALVPTDGKRRGDACTTEMLSHFGVVGPLVELSESPEWLARAFPGTRTWTVLLDDGVASWPAPPKQPQGVERLWEEPVAGAPAHPPEKLPGGWSVPVAVTKQDRHE